MNGINVFDIISAYMRTFQEFLSLFGNADKECSIEEFILCVSTKRMSLVKQK